MSFPDALDCDFAETYHVTDRRRLPPRIAATLAAGLSFDSRTARASRGTRLGLRDSLLAIAADRLAQLVWMQSKDGEKRRNRPKSLYAMLSEPEKKKTGGEARAFSSAAAFEAARAALLKEVKST